MKNIKLLDCTLRDGGYYNNWEFKPDLVKEYLNTMSITQVEYVEIGLRSSKNIGFKGPYAFSTDIFLDELNIPDEIKIGVMINASEFKSFEGKNLIQKISTLFSNSNSSRVDLVRIASHLEEFEHSLKISKVLKDMGYEVGLNLMQISEASNDQIVSFAQLASAYDLNVLYFADSLGNLKPGNIDNIISNLRKGWDGEIGIHTHDNMGLAMSNSQQAYKSGATWIDSTITGMGRGPGNLQTEYALIEFIEKEKNIHYSSVLKLIHNYFSPLKTKHNWGKNPYYYLSGLYSIHPTFIQEAIGDKRYDELEILSLIDHLNEVGGSKYSKNISVAQMNIYNEEVDGEWCPRSDIEGKDVLILGNGPSLSEHKKGIEQFIEKTNCTVISLNHNVSISDKFINFQAACHPMRVIADIHKYQNMKQPLITPFSSLPDLIKEKLEGCRILDFGLSTNNNYFSFKDKSANIPLPLVFPYVLAVANSGKASKISLAGFDGYNKDDPRNDEMNYLIKLYNENKDSCSLVSITPSKYDLTVESLYAIS
jgi:4-hydroxy 2-oxovalerate aldolase